MSMLLRRATQLRAIEDMNILNQLDMAIATGLTTSDVSLGVTVDLTKAVLIAGLPSCLFDSNADGMARIRFKNSTSATLERIGSPAAALTMQITVVEFPRAISVQFFSKSLSGTSTTQTITEVDSTANNIQIFSTTSCSGVSGIVAGVNCIARLTNDTTVTITRESASNVSVCDFFIVEYPK